MNAPFLHHVVDPMCSWCFGFAPHWAELRARLNAHPSPPEVRLVMGGLAPDSDEPMEAAMREYVRGAWRAVEERTGVRFEWSFWERCTPRRSTYPACRAVLVAEHLQPGAGPAMFEALQRAYYEEARNPSDTDTHAALAAELDPPLDAARFEELLASEEAHRLLEADLDERRRLRVTSFPSLVLERDGAAHPVLAGFATADEVWARLEPLLRRSG
jgi:putative protein-disulfide isomerase